MVSQIENWAWFWGRAAVTTMDPPTQTSLDQILATIPPQNRQLLDQKISDIHLANIARSLISWKSVCSHLGITEPEEEAIEEENRTADSRRRAVLRKWRQKYSPTATYRNLARCFYNASKPEMVEAVCKALGAPSDSAVGQSASLQGFQTAVPPPGTQQMIDQFGNPVGSHQVPHQPQGGTAFGYQPILVQPQPPQQGGIILAVRDLYILTEILRPAAHQWQAIGGALGVLQHDLNIIQHSPMLIPEGPPGYFREMLSQWLNWAPPNHSWPTIEALALAIQSIGQEGLAVNLKTMFLQKKGIAGVSGLQTQPAGPVYNPPQPQTMYPLQQMPQQPFVQLHMTGQPQQLQQPHFSGYTNYPQQMQHQSLPGTYGDSLQSMPSANYGVSQPHVQQFPATMMPPQQMQHQSLPGTYDNSLQNMPSANYGVSQPNMPHFPATMIQPQQTQQVVDSSHPRQPTVSNFFPSQDKQTVIPDGGPDKEPFDRYEAYPPGNIPEMKLSFGTVIPDTKIKPSADRGAGKYEMRATPHGIAVIINNEEFATLSSREGTDIDEKNLIQTFRYLGYTVEVHREKTSKQILSIFEDIQKRDHSKHDSFVCCILSHGKGKGIYGCDGVLVETEAISSKLNGKTCQTLIGKPKMYFIQACRGKAKDPIVTDSDESEGDPFFSPIVTDSGESVPVESDFFFGYATPLTYVAFRDMDNGSWYITELCRYLCTYGASASLKDIHTRVNDEVSQRYQHQGRKQIPEIRSRLRKDVYFI